MCTTLCPTDVAKFVCLSAPGECRYVRAIGEEEAEVWIEAMTPSALCELDLGSRGEEAWLGEDSALHGAELFRLAHRAGTNGLQLT